MLVSSGYSGQLKYMNANDAFLLFVNGIRTDIPYWSGKYHILISKMVEFLKSQGCKLYKNTTINDVIKVSNGYKVLTNSKTLLTRKIIFCTPKDSLMKFSCLNTIKAVLDTSISCKALCRVYALFDRNEEWLLKLKKKYVVNNPLRYIIPMNPEQGLIMISYTDDKYTDYWKDKENNEDTLKKSIVKLIKEGLNIQVNQPKKVYV